jgi:hypothetical protein
VATRGSSGLHPDHRQPKLHTQTFKLLFRTDVKLATPPSHFDLRTSWMRLLILHHKLIPTSPSRISIKHHCLDLTRKPLIDFRVYSRCIPSLHTSTTNDNINRGLSSMFNLLCNYPPSDKTLLLPPSCPRQRATLAPTLGQIASKTLYLLDSSSVPSHTTNLQKVSRPR